jgi:protease I
MAQPISGKRVAILCADDFEQVELTGPRQALDQAGVKTTLIGPEAGEVKGMHHDQPGDTFPVDLPISSARANDFDALLLPGGVANPDLLRTIPRSRLPLATFFCVFEKPGLGRAFTRRISRGKHTNAYTSEIYFPLFHKEG